MKKGDLITAGLAGMNVPCRLEELQADGQWKVAVEGPTSILYIVIPVDVIAEEENHEAYDYNDGRDDSAIRYRNQYMDAVEKADQKHPDWEDISCARCGMPLIKGSTNYDEGFHIDGCE